jgi:hypothetical protein
MSSVSPDSLHRQTAINEWYYKYRLDTLFVLQLAFIGFSFVLLMAVLSKYGMISPMFVVYSGIFIVLFLFIVWYFKYTYSNSTRDLYHWDKRKFAGDGTMNSAISTDVQRAMNDILASCRK